MYKYPDKNQPKNYQADYVEEIIPGGTNNVCLVKNCGIDKPIFPSLLNRLMFVERSHKQGIG